ncbi:MAG: hypothetical protein O3B90_12495, partial [Actinomycetota bacterium]|nr:hypothetical protein [Actinomycetota bacterium]
MSCDTCIELQEKLVEAEDGEVGQIETAKASIDNFADRHPVFIRCQADTKLDARAGRFVALIPAEDEENCRQHVLLMEQLQRLDPTGRHKLAAVRSLRIGGPVSVITILATSASGP